MVATVVTGRQFQSTPSVWRETLAYYMVRLWQAISIHSLRVEGDPKLRHFCSYAFLFQSTPSVWRETSAKI